MGYNALYVVIALGVDYLVEVCEVYLLEPAATRRFNELRMRYPGDRVALCSRYVKVE